MSLRGCHNGLVKKIILMKNTHLEHAEDSILTGDLSVLDWFVTPGTLSVKIDGAPAIVFGTNPANGKFFVGTKSVFNKVKIKICYSQEDVFALYDETTHASLIEILCACLKYLPRTETIYQADFIGFGGSKEYTPNTITYQFPEIVRQTIIIAPHTCYYAESDLRDAVAMPDRAIWNDTETVKFVKPTASIFAGAEYFADLKEICEFAKCIAGAVEFATPKDAAKLKQQLNACIREGKEVKVDDFDNKNLVNFWKLVKSIKEDALHLCRNDGPAAYIGYYRIDSEGYVMTNEFGMFKLVNREVFSHANFAMQKNW
jgi:hypothetical protein